MTTLSAGVLKLDSSSNLIVNSISTMNASKVIANNLTTAQIIRPFIGDVSVPINLNVNGTNLTIGGETLTNLQLGVLKTYY